MVHPMKLIFYELNYWNKIYITQIIGTSLCIGDIDLNTFAMLSVCPKVQSSMGDRLSNKLCFIVEKPTLVRSL